MSMSEKTIDQLSTDCVNALCGLDMKYTFVTDDFDAMLRKIQLLDEEAHRQIEGTNSIDAAIQIVVDIRKSMESDGTHYLVRQQMYRVFQYLCDLKYFPEWDEEEADEETFMEVVARGYKDLGIELKTEAQLKAENQPYLGKVSTCVQCDNYIQFDGKVWFHVNGALRHAAIPARTENTQKADSHLNAQLANERQTLESASAVDTIHPPVKTRRSSRRNG